jgi:AcrR family transcriptional regulator
MAAPTDAPARPGRQRSEAADQSILAAALDVLAADGYAGLTMAAVIARSGVSSATLYRRWQTKHDLVAAALASLHHQIVDIDTGSLDGDVAAFVRSLADAMAVRRDDVAEQVAVALRHNPEFSAAVREKFHVPRLAVLGRILDRARARGEIGAGLSATVAISFVSGPLHHRVYVLGDAITPAFLRSTIAGSLAALRALAPTA